MGPGAGPGAFRSGHRDRGGRSRAGAGQPTGTWSFMDSERGAAA